MSDKPIRAGEFVYQIGGNLHTASQCFDDAGDLLLQRTDADDETLRKVLEISQSIHALSARITEDPPAMTAAERHTK